MEFIGKIIAVAAPQQGVSQKTGQPWMTQTFVAECEAREVETEYGKAYIPGGKLVFEVFGQDEIMKAHIQPGVTYKIHFMPDARQAQDGRWYGSNRASRVTVVGAGNNAATNRSAQAQQPFNAATNRSAQPMGAQQPGYPAGAPAQGWQQPQQQMGQQPDMSNEPF